MTITERLLALDSTLSLHDEGEWGNTVSEYSAFNDAGVECETGELFYSMTQILKPRHVLETGTHWGIGASYIGMALKDNGETSKENGVVTTIEFNEQNYKVAHERFEKLGLFPNWVDPRLGDVARFIPNAEYELMILDTEPQLRFNELQHFWPYLKEGGFVFIHDLHRHMHQIPNEEHGFAWPFFGVTDFMKQMFSEGKMRPFHFPTPRGLTGFYKVSQADYSWPSV